jgi:poly(hydroxyalkanoate) depolymerase family esterase
MAIDIKTVLRLTRAGRLMEATKSIQSALSPNTEATPKDDNPSRTMHVSPRRSRPLGEVITKLRQLPSKVIPGMKTNKKHAPNPHFQNGTFTCAAGTRTYKLYVPTSLPVKRRGLIVMLHGCKQNADDFATGTRMNEIAEKEGLVVVYPNQTASANNSGCWNWFSTRDQSFGKGEPSIIAGITSEISKRFSVDPDRVFIGGMSAGGAMAVIMGHTYPDLYAAIGVHSGLPYQAAHDVISAFAAMSGKLKSPVSALKPKAIVFHGKADTTVHLSNAFAILNSPNTYDEITTTGNTVDGRKYERTLIEDHTQSLVAELWIIEGAGHAWSGGNPAGSYTDSKGPNASKEMVRFFLGGKELTHKEE